MANLKEQVTGMQTIDVCRRHKTGSAKFCRYRSKVGGLDICDARHLRTLELSVVR